jgi:hypothetical protein
MHCILRCDALEFVEGHQRLGGGRSEPNRGKLQAIQKEGEGKIVKQNESGQSEQEIFDMQTEEKTGKIYGK